MMHVTNKIDIEMREFFSPQNSIFFIELYSFEVEHIAYVNGLSVVTWARILQLTMYCEIDKKALD